MKDEKDESRSMWLGNPDTQQVLGELDAQIKVANDALVNACKGAKEPEVVKRYTRLATLKATAEHLRYGLGKKKGDQ